MTLGGILGNIRDQWTKFQKMIADAGLFDAFKGQMQGVLDSIAALEADGTLKRVAGTISKTLVGALKGMERYGTRAFEWAMRFDWRGLLSDVRAIGRGLASAVAAIGGAIGGIRRFFRDLGSIGDGGFAETARGVGSAVRNLAGSLDGGSLTALGLGGAMLLKFGLSLGRFALGGRGLKLALIVAGLAGLSKVGGEMTAVDWAGAALGIGMLAGPILKLAGALRGLAGASAGAAVLGDVAGAGAGAAAVAGKGFWSGIAARMASLAVPTALAAGAGWALWKGPQRQPESERAGYSSRGRKPDADPLAVNGELNRLLSQLKGMRFVAEGLSKTDGSAPIAQRRGADLAGRIGEIDATIAELRNSGMVESGTGRAQLDAILSLRADISGLVPRLVPPLAPGLVAGGKEGRPAEDLAFWSSLRNHLAEGFGSAVEGMKAALKAMPLEMRLPVPIPRPEMPDFDIPIPTIRPDFVKPIEIEGEAAAAKADAIGSRISDAFSVTAMPIVDTGSIDAARMKVDGLAKALRSMPSAGASIAAPADRRAAVTPATRPASKYAAMSQSPTQAALQQIAMSRDTTIVGNIKVQVDGPGKVTDTKFAANPDRGRAVGRA